MCNGVGISFSLFLSLGEPSSQHTALDVPKLEALEDPHAQTCAQTEMSALAITLQKEYYILLS